MKRQPDTSRTVGYRSLSCGGIYTRIVDRGRGIESQAARSEIRNRTCPHLERTLAAGDRSRCVVIVPHPHHDTVSAIVTGKPAVALFVGCTGLTR